jgi:hypothetical protein
MKNYFAIKTKKALQTVALLSNEIDFELIDLD